MFLPRTLSATLARLEADFPAILITGARQVGKSTLLKQAHPDIPYVSLDDPDLRLLAQTDPKLFVQRFPAPLIIDEVQYAPALFSILKLAIDTRRRKGMYWLSGSQQFHLMKNVSDSLAGRIGVLHLAGLSTRELLGDFAAPPFLPPGPDRTSPPCGIGPLFDRIWRGSFPHVAIDNQANVADFYKGYVATYIQRDVRDLAQVGDVDRFFLFMKMAAARTGQLLNISQLANDSDTPVRKVSEWLSILEASGIILRLNPYHSNRTKRLVKAPKLYFVDTGLAAWLAGWESPTTLMTGASSGAFLETYAITEVWKSYIHHGREPPLWFYRDHDQREIDLLITNNGMGYPMDVKMATSVDARTARRLLIDSSTGLLQGNGLLLTPTDRRLPLTETVDCYPIGWL